MQEVTNSPLYPLIFNPQTSGVLLASVPVEKADACVKQLQESGFHRSTIVGRAIAESDRLEPATLIV